MKKVLISVDDFGISEVTNSHILTLIESGKVDRVSIMMNGLLVPLEVQKLLSSGVKLDIHLDRKHIIHENRKLADGFLVRFMVFIWSYFFGSNRPSKVHLVWHNQIQEFQRIFGRSPDGLNTHEHVHYFPPYFRALLRLASEYNIPFIRLGKRNTKNYTFVAFVINILGMLNRGALTRTTIQTTDRVMSWDWVEEKMTLEELKKSLEEGTVTEVIFHPERQEEFDFLQREI